MTASLISRKLAFFLLSIGVLIASSSIAAEEDYVFCFSQSKDGSTRYYSTIFVADYLEADRFAREFFNDLKYSNADPDRYNTRCLFGRSRSLAEVEYDNQVFQDEYYYDAIVHTGWKP